MMNGLIRLHLGEPSRRKLDPEEVRRLMAGDTGALTGGPCPTDDVPRMLMVDPKQCNGCRLCETACSLFHEGEILPSRSRIQVAEWRPGMFFPIACQQCTDAPCRKACPKEAITWRESDARVVIDYHRCVSCRMCVSACPFGAMRFDPFRQMVFKCDTCGGNPQCVPFCEPGALTFPDADTLSAPRRREAAGMFRRS